jgi:hypothetical protein
LVLYQSKTPLTDKYIPLHPEKSRLFSLVLQKPFILKTLKKIIMGKHSFLSYLLCVLLILTLSSCDVASPISVSDEPFEETYNVSFAPTSARFFLNVLIPSDATIKSCILTGISGGYYSANFTYSGCFNLRCYKFAQATVGIERTWPYNAVMNVNVTVTRNSVPCVPCLSDTLADKLMQRLKYNSSSVIFTPSLTFVNLNNSDSWRGYPVFSVNKNLEYQLPDQKVDYLVISSIEKFTTLYDLMVLKSQQGMNTFFVSTQDIDSNYVGESIQYKTIEYLKDAYNKWHMPYVLIVGNTATLPPISYTTYNFYDGRNYINDSGTCDYYYSTLDQPASEFSHDWSYRASLDFPDFILGRFPFDDTNQISRLVTKTIEYENNSDPGDWVRKNLIVGGEGATNQAVLPCQYTNDRPMDKLVYPENFSIQSLVSEVNDGVGSVLIATHGTPSSFSVGGGQTFSYNEVSLLNNAKLPVIFTMGCHTGKFDVGTSGSQSVAVALLSKQNSGAVAIVSGTSYTPYGDYVYYSAYNYWNKSNNVMARVPDANYDVGKAFYYFCTLNPIDYMILLGDPALQVATANYDLPPSPTPSPVPAPTMRPIPTPTAAPTKTPTATSTPTSQPTNKPPQNSPTPIQTAQPTPKITPTPITTANPHLNEVNPWLANATNIIVVITAIIAVVAIFSFALRKKAH